MASSTLAPLISGPARTLTVCSAHSKNLLHLPRRHKFKFYDKKVGLPVSLINRLQQDYDFSIKGLTGYMLDKYEEKDEQRQKFISERHHLLGPDLASATFILGLGGAAKFVGKDMWLRMTDKTLPLPRKYVPNMHLEGIDASNTQLFYTGLENLIDLQHLKYLNFSNCKHLDDWWINPLQEFKETLEVLDLSGCKGLTERGLECVHHLENLTALRICDMDHIPDLEHVTLLIEEAMPQLQIIGVKRSTPEDMLRTEEKIPEVKQEEEHIPRTMVEDVIHSLQTSRWRSKR